MPRYWTTRIGQQLPRTVQNNLATSPMSPARSRASRRSNGKVSGASRRSNGKVSAQARSPALPFNRVNGKAALALSVRGPSLYVRI